MSWFEQIDFSSIQDQLVRSVGEASDLISTVNRLELLNLDELAKQQEEEERLEALQEEAEAEEEEELNEEEGGAVDWADLQASSSAFVAELREGDTSFTHEELVPGQPDLEANSALPSSAPPTAAAPGASAHWEVLSPPGKEVRIVASRAENPKQSSAPAKGKKLKKRKKKKKKTHLDFFGIRSNNDDSEDEDEKAREKQQPQQQQQTSQASTDHVSEVGFDISALWDDAPSAPQPEYTNEPIAPAGALQTLEGDVESGAIGSLSPHSKDVPSSSGAVASGTLGSASTFLTDLFTTAASSMHSKVAKSSGMDTVQVVLRSQAVSFFDNVDAEIDLENDPILKKVEENKLGAHTGHGPGAFNMTDYLNYFQTLIPMPSSTASSTGNGLAGVSSSTTTVTSSSTSLPSRVQLTGLSRGLEENAGMEVLLDKLSTEWRVVARQLVEQWTPLWQQFHAVLVAAQWSMGSILLTTASVSYLVIQLLLCILSFVLKASLALVLFLLEVILLAVRRLFALRNDRFSLPCTVETFSSNRRWVREHIGAWAGRLQSQYFRANYIIGIAVALLLVLSYWQFEGFLMSSDAAAV